MFYDRLFDQVDVAMPRHESQRGVQGPLTKVIDGVTLRRVILGVVLIMSLRTLTFFPGIRPLEELWFGVCLVAVIVIYPLLKVQSDWTFRPWELYLCVVLPIIVILPAITSQNEFGQPLLYGILARRSVALDASWLLFIGAWRRRWINGRDTEVVLLSLTWTTFAIYTLMRLFLNPASFPGAPPGFLTGSGTEGVAFSVPGCFMVFGVLYYALRGLRERRWKYYVFAVLLFVNAIGPSGRFLSVSLLATIGYFLFRWRPLNQVLYTLAVFALVGGVLMTLAYLVNPELVRSKSAHYTDAFQVVVGGAEVADASSNARVVETDIALPYIKAHPLVGVGILSNQWSGSADAIAEYFFTDDIGFVGIVFNYGLLGLGLLTLQYLFAISAGLRVRFTKGDPLMDATKAFVIYTVIYSATTGLFVFSFEQSSFFITLLVLLTSERSGEVATSMPTATRAGDLVTV